MRNINRQSGVTMFISIVVMGALLLISTAIVTLAVKQSILANVGRDSQYAFYAADAGVECALYWDVKNDGIGYSAFSTSTGSVITCNKDASNSSNQFTVGGSSISTFTLTFLPQPYCAKVTVTKSADLTTKIESLGYNTCSALNPRRVERAVRVTY